MSTQANSPPVIMSAKEVAEMIGVNKETVYRLARKDEIPCKHIGSRIVFVQSQIIKWLNNEM